jgi:hypothetical protein
VTSSVRNPTNPVAGRNASFVFLFGEEFSAGFKPLFEKQRMEASFASAAGNYSTSLSEH